MEGTTKSLATTPRPSTLSNKTRERDGNCCILTKDDAVDVCHIFPYCLGKYMDQRSLDLWSVLETFWGRESTAECQEILFGSLNFPGTKTLTNNLGNLITLAP